MSVYSTALKFILLVFFSSVILIGCNSAEPIAPEPAATTIVAALPATATALPPTAVPGLAEPPTLTPVPTLAAPPTATPLPEPTAAEEEPTPVAEATALPEEENGDGEEDSAETGCRPLDELTHVGQNRNITPAPWPKPAAWAGELYYTNASGPSLIHLGFDVEGNVDELDEILDILDRYNVKTTMFVLGSWASTRPEWLLEFEARGHEFANHSWTHGNLGDMTPEEVVSELNLTEELVQQVTGQTTKPWLRPPFGSRSPESMQAAYDLGYTTVVWSSSTDDWRQEYTEDDMCRSLLDGSYPGGILYTHSYRPEIPAVIERYIAEMIDRGYTFVPMSVLMAENPASFIE
jgi:peptidoglycan/xylan/chitin deacetylase (PgdA/CDA1 family)